MNCASGWVPYNGGTLERRWRVDGGCFWQISNAEDCNAAWAICARSNSQLATKRSYLEGTKAPLTVRELQKLVPKLSGDSESYVCVTKYDGYIPPEANIQESKKACSTVTTAKPSFKPSPVSSTSVPLKTLKTKFVLEGGEDFPLKTSKTKFVLEGGEILEQTQSFNPNTRELTVSVPAHGDREAVTIIYGEKEMVTAHDTYCLVGEPPKDLNMSVYENKKLLPDRPLYHNNVSSVFIFNVIDEDEMTKNEKKSLPESFKALCKNKALRRTSQVNVDKTIFQMNHFNKSFLDSLVTKESTRSFSSLSRLYRKKRTANSGSRPTEVKACI